MLHQINASKNPTDRKTFMVLTMLMRFSVAGGLSGGVKLCGGVW